MPPAQPWRQNGASGAMTAALWLLRYKYGVLVLLPWRYEYRLPSRPRAYTLSTSPAHSLA